MQHAITVADILTVAAIIGIPAGLLGLACWFLSGIDFSK